MDTAAAAVPVDSSRLGHDESRPDDGLDFGLAFDESALPDSAAYHDSLTADSLAVILRPDDVPDAPESLASEAGRHNHVRVLVTEQTRRAVCYFLDTVSIRWKGARKTISCVGRIVAEQTDTPGSLRVQTTHMGKGTVVLPCTLLARARPNYFEYEEKSYRGSIILQATGSGFRVVNYLPVEDYLRGVVPLEIGRRSLSEIEAVKAQAIAARTYTYRKIVERADAGYDVLPTVADQVYGGVAAEHPLCDMAVRLTEGLVMTWKGSPIYAYYHSTCGGMTANIEDVWNKAPQPYLRAIRDVDRRGKAYCANSRLYSWEQKWTPSQLSSIVAKYGPATFPRTPPLQGAIADLTVRQCYDCGRVAQCRIESAEGAATYGGDRIRFVLRREGANDPILYSARFTVAAANRKEIRLQGRGNGHGVGMCQMGALGRASQGQSYSEILQAYYPGVTIERVGR